MRSELTTLLIANQICNVTYLVMLIKNFKENVILNGICKTLPWVNSYIPPNEISRILNLLICFYISIIRPLSKTKLYH